MGTDGSGDEMGNLAMVSALSNPLAGGHNDGFLREQAGMAVIIISDEEDDSPSGANGNLVLTPQGTIQFLRNLKPDPAMVSYSTIVPPRNGCSTAYDSSDIYHDVRNAIGGINASICDTDWAQVLDDLANNAAALRREFFLNDIPDPNSLQVWVIEPDGTRVDLTYLVDFTYNAQRNSVLLTSYIPEPLAEVFIAYDLLYGAQD